MEIDYNKIKNDLINNQYKYIGSGSGRRVFDLGNEYVVKVAKNHKGIAQNKAEYSIGTSTKSELLAPIIGISMDNQMLIMGKGEKINSMSIVWNYYNVLNNYGLYQMVEMKKIINEYGVIWVDLCKPGSWGIIDGKAVVIDYGFTRYVRRKWYFLNIF